MIYVKCWWSGEWSGMSSNRNRNIEESGEIGFWEDSLSVDGCQGRRLEES